MCCSRSQLAMIAAHNAIQSKTRRKNHEEKLNDPKIQCSARFKSFCAQQLISHSLNHFCLYICMYKLIRVNRFMCMGVCVCVRARLIGMCTPCASPPHKMCGVRLFAEGFAHKYFCCVPLYLLHVYMYEFLQRAAQPAYHFSSANHMFY